MKLSILSLILALASPAFSLSNEQIKDKVSSLNISAFGLVNSIGQHVKKIVPNAHFHIHYEFHDHSPDSTATPSTSTRRLGDISADINENGDRLINSEVDTGLKGYDVLWHSVANIDDESTAKQWFNNQTRAFGWIPVQDYLKTLGINPDDIPADDVHFGGGGGFGATFLCGADQTPFVTLGGGGGGGVTFNKNQVESFGGGGGGGVQFRYINPDGTWSQVFDIGGGGGCKSIDASDGSVMCQGNQDNQNDANDDVVWPTQDDIKQLKSTIRYCYNSHELNIIGSSSSPQYHTAFALSSSSSSSTRRQLQSSSSYDIVGDSTKNASETCTGGYGNWCCVCSTAQYNLAHYLKKEYKSVDLCPTQAEVQASDARLYLWSSVIFLSNPCCTSRSSSGTSTSSSSKSEVYHAIWDSGPCINLTSSINKHLTKPDETATGGSVQSSSTTGSAPRYALDTVDDNFATAGYSEDGVKTCRSVRDCMCSVVGGHLSFIQISTFNCTISANLLLSSSSSTVSAVLVVLSVLVLVPLVISVKLFMKSK